MTVEAEKKVNPVFSIGDMVVYAKHGVGVVDEIKQMEFRGENYSAYTIHMKASGIKLSVPTDSAGEMGLRNLKDMKEIEKSIKILEHDEEIPELCNTKTWKERKKVLDEMFRQGEPEELAKIVKYLYGKNNIKDLPNSERKIYDFSLKFLIHEIAVVKDISETEADNIIAECLCN